MNFIQNQREATGLVIPNEKGIAFINWLDESTDNVKNLNRVFQEYLSRQPHIQSIKQIAVELYDTDMVLKNKRGLMLGSTSSIGFSLGYRGDESRQFVLFLLSLTDESGIRDSYSKINGHARYRNSIKGGKKIEGISTGRI